MLGYLYQCREALLLAIRETKINPSVSISIERFDDVAFEDSESIVEQIQLKHHVDASSLTDMSVDLWKTLRIWCNQVALNPQLPFERRFTIITTSTAPADSAAELLRAIRPTANAEQIALQKLISAAQLSKNQETQLGRKAFLELPTQDQVNLISAIQVFDNSPQIGDVRSEIESELYFAALDNKLQILLDHLEGWWFAQIVVSLSHPDAPSISLLTLRAKIDEIASRLRDDDLLIHPDLENAVESKLPDSDDRIFVRQLNCIDLDSDSIELAKLDYYRATTQRSNWARENALLDGEAARYDASLVERWKRQTLARKSSTNIDSEDEKKQFGAAIFFWAIQEQAPFRNRHEQWLCSGSFQILADKVSIGWHPDHKKLFTESNESGRS